MLFAMLGICDFELEYLKTGWALSFRNGCISQNPSSHAKAAQPVLYIQLPAIGGLADSAGSVLISVVSTL